MIFERPFSIPTTNHVCRRDTLAIEIEDRAGAHVLGFVDYVISKGGEVLASLHKPVAIAIAHYK